MTTGLEQVNRVNILSIEKLTHDVLRIKTKKPMGYSFIPGQATEVAIHKNGRVTEKRPFTFTSLPIDPYLEFIIKTYPLHNGITKQLLQLEADDELILHDTWGAITYRGAGIFIAGGAGITPFISIFRQLEKENRLAGNGLIYANKTRGDIILENELKKYMGDNMVQLLSNEIAHGYKHGLITDQLIQELIPADAEHIYVCGPPPMIESVLRSLERTGISNKTIIVEL